jgi:hypothetical protein
VRLQLGLNGCQLAAGPGGGQAGDAKAEPEPVGQLVGVDGFGGGDGLDAADGGPLPALAEEDQDGSGGGQAKWSSQGRPVATETARSRAAQVLPALSWAARTP